MLAQALHHDVVVIIGAPGSGKTYITEQLAASNPEHIVIHTDDYIVFGYENSLYKLLEDLQTTYADKKLIIEGVGAYRLLRKGVETDSFYPDAVIEVQASDEQIEEVYATERGKDITKVRSMQKGNQTVLDKYKLMENKKPPVWIYYDNNI